MLPVTARPIFGINVNQKSIFVEIDSISLPNFWSIDYVIALVISTYMTVFELTFVL